MLSLDVIEKTKVKNFHYAFFFIIIILIIASYYRFSAHLKLKLIEEARALVLLCYLALLLPSTGKLYFLLLSLCFVSSLLAKSYLLLETID